MSTPQTTKRSGYLFIAVGFMLFLAAYIGKQDFFWGIGVAFIAIGASYLARANRS